MGHYIKAQTTTCHYHFDPNCPICHGNENWRDRFGLPCRCGLERMTFERTEDTLMKVEVEPLPDGGVRVHMQDVEVGEN
ncbi:unnamed protein product [marine sediment metagenome]|uniref:Uncharacterized protein n=1 Tax=marine sediment metagenome TaxID=412755 RepID=X1DDP6_9ZZZZ